MHEALEPSLIKSVNAPLFSIRSLDYTYPDQSPALTNINLEIEAGDRIALVGQNGSGKTTLIKQLCGLLQPVNGEVLYKREPLREDHLERSRLEIGLLFQDPDDQLFCHTLLDDAAFGPRQKGVCRQDAEAAALKALNLVSLSDMAYKEPHNLSFGQKKRAALAGLLAMNPDVLLLDEPTANLDPRQEQLFMDLLGNYQGTLICISHDLIFLYELCNRAVVLDKGHLQHDYTIKELVSQRHELKAHGLDFSFRLIVKAPEAQESCSLEPVGGSRHGNGRHASNGHASTTSPADTPLVALKDYNYRYPDGTQALGGIDLSITAGERISIVGENGAGKTTLLSCLLGLRQGRGQFCLDGKQVTSRDRKKLWQKMGMVFQDCADQLFCSSVEEEVSFGLIQLGCSKAEIQRRADQALAMVHLEGFKKRVPLHMSGGERKRIALASVLAMSPRLLILDEPTAGLDPKGEALLLEIIKDLDVTLLLVSHDMFFVRELTSRTLVMHQGKILEDLPVHSFMSDTRLGNLNGLSYTCRQQSSSAIRMLQHEHEHSHLHNHLHTHQHRHGEVEHDHFHEHLHEHNHRFIHHHLGDQQKHDHIPSRYHDHDHPGHHSEEHDHH